ncbi:hypothetical protein GCM10011575_42510 [Microlunatus endophyticus]|uniref:Copper resistance protein D n=1 Tax=Microlunatus endophyticus TaxID=1716077 RepID=A0A917W949_9ACTN|nr:cytochrome c oxidase assembly protein [Microlunatus endophyticus]GGL79703.1 hypothetical protein GCM10011575_42510 [Microlunatus endophyticus]
MGRDRLTPWTWHAVVSSWSWRPGWIVVAVLLAAGYALALWWCRRAGRQSVGLAPAITFFSALLLLVLTVCSAFDTYSMALFWVHMIEHLLLIMVVPALLVLGHPLTLLRNAIGAKAVDRGMSVWPVAVLTHPLVGFVVYAAALVGTHLTHFMDLMAVHPWMMGAERVLYVVAGYLFLLPLLGNEPIRWRVPLMARLLLILVAMGPDTIVGIVLMQSNDPFPVMLAMRPSWAPSPAQDVLTGGGIMWVGGDGLMMVIGLATIAAILFTRDSDKLLGGWLERTRRSVLAQELGSGGEPVDSAMLSETSDVDDDQVVLDAYNRMLSRLKERE